MKLGIMLSGMPVTKIYQTMYGRMVVTHDVEVHRLQYDSRKVERGDCFVALRGTASDGHRFIEQAISNGAKSVVMEVETLPDSFFMHAGVAKIVVPNSRRALAHMASVYYGEPTRKLKMIGVTGTNGKTTTSEIIRAIMEEAGERTGLIGTIEYRIGDAVIPATHTTPESLELNELFSKMVDAGCTAASMEVSSHALHQSRVHGIRFAAAIFTNLTQDHLDYHGTMEEYFRSKRMLFDGLDSAAVAVTNADDPYGDQMVSQTAARRVRFGLQQDVDVRGTVEQMGIGGSVIHIDARGTAFRLETQLVGRFNVSNVLAAAAAALHLDVRPADIISAIAKKPPVRGRFEQMTAPKGWTAIVDYAHTPDALEKCLQSIRLLLSADRTGRVITVFGAGGDRDRTKRPLMGRIAASLSDMVIVTSDNPRTEDPEAIIGEIAEGIADRSKLVTIVDRAEAIRMAVSKARSGDVVLVAGKGHEDYQVIGKEKIHFSDREVIEACF